MDNTLDIITIFNPDSEPFYIQYDNKSYGMVEPGKARRMPRFMAKLAVKHLVDQCINRIGGNTANQPLRDQWVSRIVIDEEIYAPVEDVSEDEKLRRDIDELNRKSDLDRILAGRKGDATQTQANFAPQAQVSQQITPQPAPVAQHEIPANQMQAAPVAAPTPPVQAPASMTPSQPVVPVTPPAPAEPTLPNGGTIPASPPPVTTPPVVEKPAQDPEKPQVLPEVDMTADDPTPPTQPIAPATETPAVAVEPTREELYGYATSVLGMTFDEKTKATLDAQDIPQLKETLGYDPTAAR